MFWENFWKIFFSIQVPAEKFLAFLLPPCKFLCYFEHWFFVIDNFFYKIFTWDKTKTKIQKCCLYKCFLAFFCGLRLFFCRLNCHAICLLQMGFRVIYYFQVLLIVIWSIYIYINFFKHFFSRKMVWKFWSQV